MISIEIQITQWCSLRRDLHWSDQPSDTKTSIQEWLINNVSPVKQIASVSELQFHYIPSYKHANEEQIRPLQCTAQCAPSHPSCLLVAVMEKKSSQYFFFPPDLATQFSGAQSPGRYCVFPAMASWTHLTVPCWMNAGCRWIGRGSWPGFWRQTAAIKECSALQQCR